MAQTTEHVELDSLWRIAKRRARLTPEQVSHIRACDECAHAVLLCDIHRSFAKVREALDMHVLMHTE
jgi:hypothetical protein